MKPLAYRYRPESFDEFVGQEKVVSLLKKFLSKSYIPSIIFWGPPGSGKTTLAKIIAKKVNADFYKLSAVMAGKSDLKKIISIAQRNLKSSKRTILFLDEIHRWNKAQQDGLLPYVEDGTIILIGATTENPSFYVISALLSRCRVMVLNSLASSDIFKRLKNVVKKMVVNKELKSDMISDKPLLYIAKLSNGDMRTALNILEMVLVLSDTDEIDIKLVEKAAQKVLFHDKHGDKHYNLISAVHKSLRSSNGIAASYYIMRMLQAGEDPLYIARRLLRFAGEDIGNAKPAALFMANAVYDACQKVGMPESAIFLVQLALYLANAPRDNTAYKVESFVKELINKYGNLPVPLHFRNAPTKFMKKLGYGKNYKYDHKLVSKKSQQQCWPDKLEELFKKYPVNLDDYIPPHFRE